MSHLAAKKTKSKTSKELALLCAKLALDKKTFNLRLMDIRPWKGLHDYVLICSATSFKHAQTIADHILETLKNNENILPVGLEGYESGKWILVDFHGVIIHIFYEYIREFYDLEGLWNEAPEVSIPKSYRK